MMVLDLVSVNINCYGLEYHRMYLCVSQDTKEMNCLRLFLDYHGLSLIWSWMVDAAETAIDFKTQVG